MKLLDYNQSCINVYESLMLQLVNVELSLTTLYTAGLLNHIRELLIYIFITNLNLQSN